MLVKIHSSLVGPFDLDPLIMQGHQSRGSNRHCVIGNPQAILQCRRRLLRLLNSVHLQILNCLVHILLTGGLTIVMPIAILSNVPGFWLRVPVAEKLDDDSK